MRLHLLFTRHRRLLSVAAIVAALVAFFTFPGLGAAVISPIAGSLARAATSLYTLSFWARKTAAISSDGLAAQSRRIIDLTVDKAELGLLRSQNEELRRELDFAQRAGMTYAAADILAKSIKGDTARFVINAGSSRGIAEGDPVIASDGILVGKVVAVTQVSATVATLADAQSVTAVGLINSHQTIGIANGIPGRLLSISFIPPDEPVATNDIVVTSGLEEKIPSGLIVGIVNAVESAEGSLFQTAVVEPMQDVRLLSSVLVLTQTRL